MLRWSVNHLAVHAARGRRPQTRLTHRRSSPMRTTRLLTSGTLLAGGAIGAALFCGIPSALANEDPAADPPNCTSADLEGVRAGVDAATSAYLFTHPDVNWFVTSLE